ncbi:uncharacterized protein LOC110455843 [Mizuhopecten yessoensis]|uniref:Chitin-binding type-4 domain-containing protein n=1 Tax=Mizuhopecten yessoensis TaxID=6573 RepID=A0A210QC64_MIZYE|nr:uncharacterized protein LOC110455843 [Mizuhopecten yessoensis]OWF46337.1 hypothetical protein KP79_PYT04810 [Mizuhopecten yessoensis]
MLSIRLPFIVCVWINVFDVVNGHGLMLDPPGRSSMWRVGFGTPSNYDDNGLNCGDLHQPLDFMSGNCGLCGDPLEQEPKENEAGGKFATGIISKYYHKAEIIKIKILLTSNHGGFFEFRLCENNDVTTRITRKCLKHLLVNPDTGETRYPVVLSHQTIDVSAKLPGNVTCSQCVLQWRYRTATTIHYTEDNCELCGDQEEFYACSDIAIIDPNVPTPPVKTGTTTTSSNTTAERTTKTTPNTTTTTETTTKTSPSTTTTTTDIPTTTSAPSTIPPTTDHRPGDSCISISNIDDAWCDLNCHHSPPFCPIFLCKCL